MDKANKRQDEYIGLRVNKNIYNLIGTLVVPRFRELTSQDIGMLAQQKIVLSSRDIEPTHTVQLIDQAIREVKGVFDYARHAGHILFPDVRDKIIPIILLMSDHPDLNRILTYLEIYDEYVYRHSVGVALLSQLIGKARGFNQVQLLELMTAGFLHDIGKSRIPDEILNKPGKLTGEEFRLVKEHTVYGYEILKQSAGIAEMHAYVALRHHEREDGSGYPFGVTGSLVDEYSKIVAVADVFHAMTSKRVYKNPVPFYQVLKEMSDNVYGALDPASTLSFLRRIMDTLIGNKVVLSDGTEGRIVMINAHDPVHPVVEVNGHYADLSKEQGIQLEKIVPYR